MEGFRRDRLRMMREFRGWSQNELASRSGVDVAGVHRFEKGPSAPSSENLRLLANALGCTTDYLLGRDNLDNVAIGTVAVRESFAVFTRTTALSDQEFTRLRALLTHARAPNTVEGWLNHHALTMSTRKPRGGTNDSTDQAKRPGQIAAFDRKRR